MQQLNYFVSSAVYLVPGRDDRYSHRFGGMCRHKGTRPKGQKHNVHMLFDLDLSDPRLQINSYYSRLKRLPCLNALQFNCTDMVYRVESDRQIRIISLGESDSKWEADFPYQDYPLYFQQTELMAKSLGKKDLWYCNGFREQAEKVDDRGYVLWIRKHYYTPRVGGFYEMIQDVPEWDCQGKECLYAGEVSNEGRVVFLVLWEQPVPGVDIWNDAPELKSAQFQSTQIIFSLCRGCSAIHSCNRCD